MGFAGSSGGKESACNAGDSGLIPGLGRSPREGIGYPIQYFGASLGSQMVKNPPAMRETWVWSLGWEDSPGGGHGNPLQYSCLENPHGQGRLAYCSPWGHKESDTLSNWTTAHTHTHTHTRTHTHTLSLFPSYFSSGVWNTSLLYYTEKFSCNPHLYLCLIELTTVFIK